MAANAQRRRLTEQLLERVDQLEQRIAALEENASPARPARKAAAKKATPAKSGQ